MTNDKITEMDLMAYADGQLSPERSALVEAHIAADPEARQRVGRYRNLTETVSAAFDAPMREAPPDRLVQFIRNVDVNAGWTDQEGPKTERPSGQSSAAEAGNIVQFAPRRFAPPVWRMAAAAAVVAAIGVGMASYWHEARAPNGKIDAVLALGPLAPDSPLYELLERRTTGENVRLNNDYALTVVGTFRDRTMRICREVEVLQVAPDGALNAPSAAAIACRQPDGGWSNLGVATIAKPAIDAAPGGYVPSGAVEKDVLEGLLQTLGAGAVLASEAERTLLQSGWQEPR